MKLLDYLQLKKILKPLGMHGDGSGLCRSARASRRARTASRSVPVRPASPPRMAGSGRRASWPCRASDLAKWDIARIDRKILRRGLGCAGDRSQAQRRQRHALRPGRLARHRAMALRWSSMAARRSASSRKISSCPRSASRSSLLVNADFGGAQDAISPATSPRSASTRSSPPQPAAARPAARRAGPFALFDQLRTGTLDRALLTEDANYYFTPQATADYHDSLAPLGDPVTLHPARQAAAARRLRQPQLRDRLYRQAADRDHLCRAGRAGKIRAVPDPAALIRARAPLGRCLAEPRQPKPDSATQVTSVDPLTVEDDDFARHRDPAEWKGLAVSRIEFREERAAWRLWRIENARHRRGPLCSSCRTTTRMPGSRRGWRRCANMAAR
jgi:hypothetical protein